MDALNSRTLTGRFKACLLALWQSVFHFNPTAVEPPRLHDHFAQMPGPVRVVEAIRFRLGSLEYHISPHGILQEWRRICLRWALILLLPLPAVMVMAFLAKALMDLLSAVLGCLAALIGIIGLGLYIIKQKQ